MRRLAGPAKRGRRLPGGGAAPAGTARRTAGSSFGCSPTTVTTASDAGSLRPRPNARPGAPRLLVPGTCPWPLPPEEEGKILGLNALKGAAREDHQPASGDGSSGDLERVAPLARGASATVGLCQGDGCLSGPSCAGSHWERSAVSAGTTRRPRRARHRTRGRRASPRACVRRRPAAWRPCCGRELGVAIDCDGCSLCARGRASRARPGRCAKASTSCRATMARRSSRGRSMRRRGGPAQA
jgi:hypothetical protein